MSEVPAYSRLAGVYDEIVVDPCFPVWADFLVGLWSDDPDGVRSVLDVCCGTGLMAAELMSRGLEVVGIDASHAMLARARKLLGPTASLHRVTLPDLTIDGTFDAAISTFDGLNYLPPADLEASLAAIAAHVRVGGWLVFDAHTDAMLQVTVSSPVIEGEQAGHPFVLTNTADPVARVVDSRIEVEDSDGPFAETHRQYFHSDAFIRSALAGAGFDVLRVAHEYTDADADPATLRATWICRRC